MAMSHGEDPLPERPRRGKPAKRAGRPPTAGRDAWNARYASKTLLWSAEPNRMFVEEVSGLTPGLALDLGCGEGRNAVWLAERGWTVRAVDLSDVAVEKSHEIATLRGVASGIDFEVADLRDCAFAELGSDLVVMIYIHIPWSELAPVIARAAKAVAPGGTFLLIGHDQANLTEGFGGPQDPDYLYTADQVVGAIGGELHIERAGTVRRPIGKASSGKTAIDCVVKGIRR